MISIQYFYLKKLQQKLAVEYIEKEHIIEAGGRRNIMVCSFLKYKLVKITEFHGKYKT